LRSEVPPRWGGTSVRARNMTRQDPLSSSIHTDPQNFLHLSAIYAILLSCLPLFKPLIKMALLHLNDTNFKKEVLESPLPVLVDFWATWCGPCKMIAPIVEELAKEYHGKIKVVKLNVEEGPRTATHYGVMSIPTLMFFKNGKVADQLAGALNKHELKKKIEENLR